MRLMVCGKGGSGKTVISILLARALREKGYRPYIVDMDESNELLPILAGAEKPRTLADYFGGRRGVMQALRDGEDRLVKAIGEISKRTFKISEIERPYITYTDDGIGILVVGKIRELGEGCACPLNIFTRTLLKNLKLDDREVIIVDTDAGVEHVGRGVEEYADAIIAVADPTRESINIAKNLKKVADRLGRRFYIVVNKVPKEIENTVRELFQKEGLTPDIVIPYDEKIFQSCLLGSKLESSIAYENIKKLVDKMLSEVASRCVS
ncbi:MAG: ATP-binding protein [Crenarchaeota archaeon]|nr:ATP-binding protein [Thermoproteota archaeon]